MRGLYAIVDTAVLRQRGMPIVAVAAAIVEARPAALQLRAKDMMPAEVLALLRAILPLCRDRQVPLFANDRVDLAVLAGCDGVHLGQDDLPVHVARRTAPGLKIGLSTHTLKQLDDAVLARPDYVAYGPVFHTRSKLNAEQVVGLAGLSAARSRCPLPLVAIGGIDLSRAHQVGEASDLGAVIGALLPEGVDAADLSLVTKRARDLHTALRASSGEER